MSEELIKRITQKKEFSQLPKKDVEIALEKFDKPRNNDYQKIKLTRNFLRGVFSSFSSRKLFSTKKRKDVEWHLMKHKSTKERFFYYEEIYKKIFGNIKECSVIDLGAGVNGLSYNFFKKQKIKVNYVAVEAVGQLVDLMNRYFAENNLNGKAFHFSIFELEKVKALVKKQKKPRIMFLLKVIDSLEVMKRDYSKEIIKEIIGFSDRFVLSFATRSLGKGKKFSVNRGWILNFIKENYLVLNDFELGGERYLIFSKK